MNDHYIVCGGGRTGGHVIAELLATKRSFVLIERSEERVEQLHARFDTQFEVVIGDATSDASLQEAGIERARGVVSCIAMIGIISSSPFQLAT